MADCTFCKIIAGELPSANVYRDIHPAAPTHILIVPNKHIDSVNTLAEVDESLIGHLFIVAKQIAAQEGVAENGYRLVTNTNAHAGQTVFHINMHLLGGTRMKGLAG